jgi:hypothetical protein
MSKDNKLDAERRAAKLPDFKFDPKELKKGTDREMEHTESREEAEKIAKQHLFDNPKYYSQLDKVGLEDAIKFQGIKYEIIRGYYFNEGHNDKINDVITYIFNQRLKLKNIIYYTENEENKTIEYTFDDQIFEQNKEMLTNKGIKFTVGNAAELTYKLIMNNAYGKSIMKTIETETKLFTKENEFNIFIERNYNWISDYNKYGKNNDKYKVKVIKKLNDHFNICHVGVEILSMSKRIMNEVMTLAEDNKLKIYYQDTDSMHIEEQNIEILEKNFKEKYNRELIGKLMGQFHSDFDLKGADDVYASRSIFLGKKSYIDELKGVDKNGKIKTGYHIRMKGVPNSCIEYTTKKLKLNNPFELYEKLLKGDSVEFDLTESGNKANFEFTKDYKIKTKTSFSRVLKF